MQYVALPDGELRCTRHRTSFARTAACPGCVADPGEPVDVEDVEIAAAPHGCLTTEQIERAYVAEAKEILALRAGLTARRRAAGRKGDKRPVLDLHALNTAVKLVDVWTKLMRAAHECAARREDEAVVTRREREKRALDRGGIH